MVEQTGDIVVVETKHVAGETEVCVEVDNIKKHSIHSFLNIYDKESSV